MSVFYLTGVDVREGVAKGFTQACVGVWEVLRSGTVAGGVRVRVCRDQTDGV